MVAHRTAIARKAPSAPMKQLKANGRLVGRMMDYGSGRGFDANHFRMESYDPYFDPVMPDGLFDTITCNFVLNVVESEAERATILQDIRNRLEKTGRAYISVRTDHANLNGRTKIGTWQGRIVLDAPIVSKGSGFVTYCITRG